MDDDDDFYDDIENDDFDRIYCQTCLIKRPLRSKHDVSTDCCIGRFDHFCDCMIIFL